MSSEANSRPVYLVLGASGGIGSSLARILHRQQARLVLVGRDEDRLGGVARETGGEAVTLDATQTVEVESCAKRAIESHGRLDGIANCVGSVLIKPAHLTSDRDWNETLRLNLGSAFAAVRAAGKVMREHRLGGSVLVGRGGHRPVQPRGDRGGQGGRRRLDALGGGDLRHARSAFQRSGAGPGRDPGHRAHHGKRSGSQGIAVHAPTGTPRTPGGCGIGRGLVARSRKWVGHGPSVRRGRWARCDQDARRLIGESLA